ncbi:fungal-specific transcription factor domain-containing protein [Plectosphaerella plurivora]|uniref:Fungal-specific transcription factor domain-containing protein n=1 Tax=Plectosphaerella plurivora TaxID=936078 RepID=A0A9P8VJG9_9PEZI|nr:fungal-specific transcription factor domain-containing protein [Plectosphaerella plurivora]
MSTRIDHGPNSQPHSSGPPPAKRRHKSFAGCWTCRARKIKCDETRPTCRQCDAKRLDCEGYEVRLRWMPPEAGSATGWETGSQLHQPDLLDVLAHPTQRSMIACVESEHPPFQLAELGHIFYLLDNFEHTKNAVGNAVDAHLFLSNFGVFDSTRRDAHVSPGLTHESFINDDDTSASTRSDAYCWPPSAYETERLGSVESVEAHEVSRDLPVDDIIVDADRGGVISPLPETPPEPEPYHSPVLTVTSASRRGRINSDDGVQAQGGRLSLWWKGDNDAIVQNPSPHQMPELERFLLNHYVHRVVHLFCVIDYEKSPWKTIHLPRVLQSAGQLSLHGSTSTIRDGLRNVLLSISAFYLSNDHKSRSCASETDEWANHAIKFRWRAIKLLKEAVEGSTPQSPPKYKELLATMLSMITINTPLTGVLCVKKVMSGDTSTCSIHLDGAFRFMNHARTWKTKYSSKARSLHRIYFYLRVIYDSTAYQGYGKDSTSPGSSMSGADVATAMSAAFLDSTNDSVGNHTTSVLSHVSAPRDQIGTYECVYGVPQSLLILLAKTTDLIEQTTQARRNGTSARVELAEQCDTLESEILDWTTDVPAAQAQGTPSSKIIHKTTVAFHNALIVYFAQHIRLLRHSYLRAHIQVVLDCIEDIESIKIESGMLAAPLYWPAFIAGSEAFDQKLQDRFRAWYGHVETYRIASVRTGIRVLTEVWRDGLVSPSQRRITSQWRSVVERTGVRLMLS